MEFYCTRCGARLQSPDATAVARVRCGSCSGVTRMPDPGHDLPVAPLAEPARFPDSFLDEIAGPATADGDNPVAALLPPEEPEMADALAWAVPEQAYVPFARAVSLDYATPAVAEPPFIEAVDELAEKLANVQVADDDPGSMVDCPHCGSRITTYARRCNYCRHPLLGP